MSEIIGFIGLGIMGRPMALNLINAGYPLFVHARRPHMMEPLVEAGATACNSAREVAASADIIFTNVSDSADVEQVILGENGVIETVRPDSIVVDMSTISPSVTRSIAAQLAAQNIHMLDAPVSGGEQGAIDGALSIMIGGPEEIYQRVLPLFEVLGKNIVYIGAHGAGQVTKACNQLVIAQTLVAVGEAYLMARASGVEPARVREALLGGFAGSRVLESHGQRMLEHNFKPGFKSRLHQKDMRIVMEAANELGIALPGASQATQYLNVLVGTGKGELDSCAVLQIQELISGIDITSKPH